MLLGCNFLGDYCFDSLSEGGGGTCELFGSNRQACLDESNSNSFAITVYYTYFI